LLQGDPTTPDVVQIMTKMILVASESRAEPVNEIERMGHLLGHKGCNKLQPGHSLGSLDIYLLHLLFQALHMDG
jgi:hypothetical protein